MYDYIRGILTYVRNGNVTVECQGLGFNVSVTERWGLELLGALQQEIIVYTHIVLKETEHAFYGFVSREERDCFRMLISFSGIGPKLAIAILNSLPLKQLCAVVRVEDTKAIAAVPGIGKKTAEKLMLDLKQKLSNLLPLNSVEDVSWQPKISSCVEDGVQALISLGYAKASADRMIAEALKELPEGASLAEVLPIALKKNLLTSNKG
ncbi:Holliday junction branch migration protein RuvA [Chlamydia sp. 17-3921]|uniref:Holliday junction branch migration protein RuvA n=1 Tax=Chlamydia sp. 17-3921 TaxID=2675798 RepID=UPI00191B11F4|nr:Holliday junction branch migration protein RuvA [Chlamydia sp. 17-3921]